MSAVNIAESVAEEMSAEADNAFLRCVDDLHAAEKRAKQCAKPSPPSSGDDQLETNALKAALSEVSECIGNAMRGLAIDPEGGTPIVWSMLSRCRAIADDAH